MSNAPGLFRKKWLDIKIYIRIHHRYPKLFPGSKILSLLPAELEPRVETGTVIEELVSLPGMLKKMGRYLYIGKYTIVSNCSEIGSFCSISSGVRIGLMRHPQDFVSTSPVFYAARRGWVKENTYSEDDGKTVVIGNDVLISANVLIKNGVTIGHGTIIGAGSFVDHDVPPYAIVAGSPAKIIRYRFDETMIARLLESKWWERTDEEIRAAGNFNDPEKFLQNLGKK